MSLDAIESIVMAASGSSKVSSAILRSALTPFIELSFRAFLGDSKLAIKEEPFVSTLPTCDMLPATRTISLPVPPSPFCLSENYVLIGCALAAATGTGAFIVVARRSGAPGGSSPPIPGGSRKRDSKSPNSRCRREDNEDPPPPPPPPGPGSSIDDKPKRGKNDAPPSWFIVVIFMFYILVFLTISRAFPEHFHPVNRRVNRLLRQFSEARQFKLGNQAFRRLLGTLVSILSRATGAALPIFSLQLDRRVHQETSTESVVPGLVLIAALGTALVVTLSAYKGEEEQIKLHRAEPQAAVVDTSGNDQEEEFDMGAYLKGIYLEYLMDVEAPDFDAADIFGVTEDFCPLGNFGTGCIDDHRVDDADEADEELGEVDYLSYRENSDIEDGSDKAKSLTEYQGYEGIARSGKKESTGPLSTPTRCSAHHNPTIPGLMFTSTPVSGLRKFDFRNSDPDGALSIVVPLPPAISPPLNPTAPSFIPQTPSSQLRHPIPGFWMPSSQGAIPIIAPPMTRRQRLRLKKQAAKVQA